ncbi:MAG: SDR family oxidoreductase [Acidimicrobiales bacterium]|jgi:NAD(P)-dependent dehydrogenase (short-subunit alcohol dehydrogenase family)|nr:short-chain dehydrogenase [Acidimicrobiaceae bacterium]MDP6161176.1 SDR family oxidoreductase [Acidimicrobiales bacterium]HJL91297.1 SDR family oxidoreductase [Acidimicrobiales bacterium]HJO40910.1 SDR family oxidoreductase [Acidimicrobiales bacterium]
MSFTGKVAVVTGGSSGMGAATVRALASAGAQVNLIDIDRKGAEGIAKETGSEVFIGDVSNSEFCDLTINSIVDSQGQIDILVNAAGIILRADALETNDDNWKRIMAVNVDGVFFMCRSALRHMANAKSGVIVNFGSIWGDVAASGVAAYCITKGAVHQLTKALALEHAENGIRVNAVAPGEVNTPMIKSGRDKPPTVDELQDLANRTIPIKRLAEPEEIAEVVLFLASERSSYMTGSIVPVDAGYTAR